MLYLPTLTEPGASSKAVVGYVVGPMVLVMALLVAVLILAMVIRHRIRRKKLFDYQLDVLAM